MSFSSALLKSVTNFTTVIDVIQKYVKYWMLHWSNDQYVCLYNFKTIDNLTYSCFSYLKQQFGGPHVKKNELCP